MSFLSGPKNFFFPSAEEGARRRKERFNTESKAVVGSIIVGTAAVGLLAGAAVAAAGGVRAAGGAAITKFGSLSLGKQVAIGVAAPIIGTNVLYNPGNVPKALGSAGEVYGGALQVAKDPTKEAFFDFVKDNPKTVAVGAAALVLYGGSKLAGPVATGYGAYRSNENIKDQTRAIRESTDATIQGFDVDKPKRDKKKKDKKRNDDDSVLIPAVLETPELVQGETMSSDTPLTPETQVLGKEVKTNGDGTKKKIKKYTRTPVKPQNIRIQVLNQQTYIKD